jgi:hypothetical protein
MPPADESAASAPDPPWASGEDRRTTQPTLHTARLTLVPLTDEHLELEVELDSDAEVMRYLTGRSAADSAPGLTESRAAAGCSGANPRTTRTHGLKVGRLAAPCVLAARMPHADAQKAHIAQEYGRGSSHESSHGIPGQARGIRDSK